MAQPYVVSTCKRSSRTPNYVLSPDSYREHIIEHDVSLSVLLNPLSDEISVLDQRLQLIDKQHAIEESRRKLEQWRNDCCKTIDDYFQKKCQEVERYIEGKLAKQRVETNRIRTKMSILNRQQEATQKDIDLLTESIHDLANDINRFEQNSHPIEIKPLVLDEHLIHVENPDNSSFDLMSLLTVHKKINYPRENWIPLSANSNHLLIHQEPNLCLMDKDLKVVKQHSWICGTIYDACWSSSLSRFIVINGSDVFLVDENQMTIENVEILQKNKWLSCTTSDKSLFLSTKVWGSSIFEFHLLPTIKFVRQWQSPDTCARDEVINGMIYNNGMLAMTIKSPQEQSIRFETRSAITLDCLWSVKLNVIYSQNIRTRCCLLANDQWLVVDRNSSRIFHISKYGRIKSLIVYHPSPFCAVLFGSHALAVSTSRGVNIHKLNSSE